VVTSLPRFDLPALFDKALIFGGTHSREDIVDGLKKGRYQYFGGETVAAVTEIIDYPSSRKLHILFAAGDYRQMIKQFLPILRNYAIDHGCDSITTNGRRGFIRRLPIVGFKPTHVVFELELEDTV